MKISKSQLKQIIKEELDATLAEQGGGDMAAAQELAKVLAKSPAVMAAVEQAAQSPEVQAAAEGEVQEAKLPTDNKLANIAGFTGITAGGIVAVASAATGIPAIMALGITGGPALMAIGMLIKHAIDSGKV